MWKLIVWGFFPPRVSEQDKFSRSENTCFKHQQHKPEHSYDLLFKINTHCPQSKAWQHQLKGAPGVTHSLFPLHPPLLITECPPAPRTALGFGDLCLAGSRCQLCPPGSRAHGPQRAAPHGNPALSARSRPQAGTAARDSSTRAPPAPPQRPRPPPRTPRPPRGRFRLPAAGGPAAPSRRGAGAGPQAGGGGGVAAVPPGIPVPAILNLCGGLGVTRRRLAALHRIRQCPAGKG